MSIYMCTNLFLPPLCLPSLSPQFVPSPPPSIWLELPCRIINVTNTAVKRLICNTLQPTSFHNFTLRTDMEAAATAWRCEQALSFPSKGREELVWLSASIWNTKLAWFLKLFLFWNVKMMSSTFKSAEIKRKLANLWRQLRPIYFNYFCVFTGSVNIISVVDRPYLLPSLWVFFFILNTLSPPGCFRIKLLSPVKRYE